MNEEEKIQPKQVCLSWYFIQKPNASLCKSNQSILHYMIYLIASAPIKKGAFPSVTIILVLGDFDN